MSVLSRLPRPLRRLVGVGILLVLIEYVVVPQLAGARHTLDLLAHVNPALVLAGVGLEIASWFAYARLTQSLLPAQSRPSLARLTRVQLATLAVSHVVPGGNAAAAAVGYRLLGDSGVAGTDAGFAMATQGLGSAVVLNAMLWVAFVVAIPLHGFQPLYVTAAVVGLVVIALFGALVRLLWRHEDRAANLIKRLARPIPFVDPELAARAVCRAATRVRQLFGDRALVLRAIGWGGANWALDAASLWVFLAAFGHRIGPDGLIVSYGLANVLAALPVTPGGLGIVEGVLTPALVGFGVPRGIAVLGVIGWRLVNFWLPIPLGAATYVSLRIEGAPKAEPAVVITDALDEARHAAPSRAEWARERGIRVATRRKADSRHTDPGQEG